MDPKDKDIELVIDAIGLIARANRDEFMSWRNHDLLSQALGKLGVLLTFHYADRDADKEDER